MNKQAAANDGDYQKSTQTIGKEDVNRRKQFTDSKTDLPTFFPSGLFTRFTDSGRVVLTVSKRHLIGICSSLLH